MLIQKKNIMKQPIVRYSDIEKEIETREVTLDLFYMGIKIFMLGFVKKILIGGSRKGNVRTYINLSIVFLLTGIWYGASWNFIIWGIYHGIFEIIERLGLEKILKKLPKCIQHMYAMVVVVIGWVFFRANNLSHALAYIRNMFTINENAWKDV